jgi:chitinase
MRLRRGGKDEDTANFVDLVKEIKAAFRSRYSLSVTLPASYWYLQRFDVKGMEPHVDWFNIMSYDIHGVWDSSNRCSGPFTRPHANLTEIDESLSLLWRAGLSAGNVVLGLGWYGRSFKLADPSCTTPGCRFSEGATAGDCTGAPGVLSNAEIDRIIEKYDLTPTYDDKAAVNWIVWNSDQWVSYENPTLSKKVLATIQHETDAQHSCYITFCGQECAPGYSGVSQMKGRVGELGAATACTGTNFQTLCCATATFLGRCKWYGWRGEGLSYQGGCPSDHTLIAVNTNHYFNYPEQKFLEDQTCAGGTQSYCCNNVKASPMFGKDIELVDHSDLKSDPKNLAKRATTECAVFGVIAGGIFV